MSRASAAALALLALGAWARPGPVQLALAAQPSQTCATRPAALITVEDLGPFTKFLDIRSRVSPFAGFTIPGQEPPMVSAFVAGRLRGFLANLTLRNPYRQQEDALTRSMGYKVGRWPSTPLQGDVVRDNPGPLEIYETNNVYRSVAGAEGELKVVRLSAAANHLRNITSSTSSQGVDAVVAIEKSEDQVHGQEGFVEISVRIGMIVVTILVKGGAHLSVPDTTGLTQEALSDVRSACSKSI